MLKNYENIADIRIINSNLFMRELDQEIFNYYIPPIRGRKIELGIEDQEESIVFEKLKSSCYINFIEINCPFTTDQIRFLRSQIELNESLVRRISNKSYVSLYAI